MLGYSAELSSTVVLLVLSVVVSVPVDAASCHSVTTEPSTYCLLCYLPSDICTSVAALLLHLLFHDLLSAV